MKPGITGLAQVTVRNSVTWDERIVVDNQYIDRFNIWLDIKILFKTLLKIFNQRIFIWIKIKTIRSQLYLISK